MLPKKNKPEQQKKPSPLKKLIPVEEQPSSVSSNIDDELDDLDVPLVPKPKKEQEPKPKSEKKRPSLETQTSKSSSMDEKTKEPEKKRAIEKQPSKEVISLEDEDDSKPTPSSKSDEVRSRALESAKKKNFFQYQHSGCTPAKLGQKQLPEGQKNCLHNKCFLLTGVLESFEREKLSEVIKEYGGSTTKTAAKKLTHVLVGADPGESKVKQLSVIQYFFITFF